MDNKRKIEDEIKFGVLLKNPIRLFGWIFPYFFVLLVILGIFFGQQLITIPFNEQKIGLPQTDNLKQEIVEQKGGISPAVDLASIKAPTQEMINNGKELYDANCQSCHGSTGLGDGPAGIALNPKARNLQSTEGWTNGKTIEQLYKTLQEGITQNGMAAYEYLAPSDRLNIIHYIRTLADYPEITDDQINGMNQQYNLTEGVIKPNKIPVVKAVNLMIENHKGINQKIIDAKSRIEYLKDTNDGASLLLKYTFDLNKVIHSYNQSHGITLNNFIYSVTMSPISKGYKPSINRLNQQEWKAIYDFLGQLII